MKVTHPLSASSTQTYVGARYLRHGDAIWELPTARYVTGMLNEHGMQNAKPVVTLAVHRNDDDDESEAASPEEHRSLRRICGQESVLGTATPRQSFFYEPSGEVSGMSFKIVNTTPQMTCFRGAKLCTKWLQGKSDDQLMQPDNKLKFGTKMKLGPKVEN